MNNEILDYEITVLNKHEDENSLVRAEQKRKVIEGQQHHQDHHLHHDHHHHKDRNFPQLDFSRQYFDDHMITSLLKVMALQNTANKLKISVSKTKMTIAVTIDGWC